jgi:hypothetical protein
MRITGMEVKNIPREQLKVFQKPAFWNNLQALLFISMFALSGCFSQFGQASAGHSDGRGNPGNTVDAEGRQKPFVVPPTDNDIEEHRVAERESTAVHGQSAPLLQPPAPLPEDQYHSGTIFRCNDQPSF